jgi:hypothetical protein
MQIYTPEELRVLLKPYRPGYISKVAEVNRQSLYNLMLKDKIPSFLIIQRLSKFVNDHKAS